MAIFYIFNDYIFPLLAAYVQHIYDMFMASSRDELKNAAAKLKEMSPKPMDTMLEKQSKTEALKKRLERSQIVTKDVPPNTPGNF